VELWNQTNYVGQVSVAGPDLLEVVTTNSTRHEIGLEEVRCARLNPPPLEGAALRGWSLAEIGPVQGHVRQHERAVHLQSISGPIKDKKNHHAACFVYRTLREDGEVLARIDRVTGTNTAIAGILLRQDVELSGAFVLFGVTPDSKLRLEWRDSAWKPMQTRECGQVHLPLWLKLGREEKTRQVTASYSTNGQQWQVVHHPRLTCRVEPFPEDSDHWRPKLLAGFGLSGGNAAGQAQAILHQPTLTGHGLLGEYFADEQLYRLAFARLDRKVEFHWDDHSPAPDIPLDHYSVRWTGQVEPRYSEKYRFYCDADDSVQLWINGEEVPPVRYEKSSKYVGKELPLKAHQKYSIRVEYREVDGPAHVRLGWSSPNQAYEILTAPQLSYAWQPESPREEGTLVLTIVSADRSAIRVAFAGHPGFPVLNSRVARILFRSLRRALPEGLDGRPGVVMKNGDFLQGEFEQITGNALKVSSVFFGTRSFQLNPPEAVALLFNHLQPTVARLEIRLRDGSVLRAKAVRAQGDTVLVEDTSLGPVPIPVGELLEIHTIRPPAGRGVATARADR
jgi:hypothetical protein